MNRFDFYQFLGRIYRSMHVWLPVGVAIAAAVGFCVWAGFYR